MRCIFFSFIIALFSLTFFGQTPTKTCSCTDWQARVDESLGKSPLMVDFDLLSESETIGAIECLLKLEGNKKQARFSGALRDDVSSVPQNTPVEVSALYYISYLYYQKFDHATVVALEDDSAEFSTQNAIEKAFLSYKKWFERVKEIGLTEARRQKLDPLAGSGIKWY